MYNIKNKKGFTIIELIVVMAIFLFVIGAAIGIFLSIISQQRRVLAEQQLINQISYVEEYMSKALRMATVSNMDTDPASCLPPGYIYLLTNYDTAGSGLFKGIKFINQSDGNSCYEFFLDVDNILKERKNNESAVALTSSNLQINSIRFSINGSDGSATVPDPLTWVSCMGTDSCGASDLDYIQPRVSILLNVRMPADSQGPAIQCSQTVACPETYACDLSAKKCVTTRTIQTTVSQRNINVNNGQR